MSNSDISKYFDATEFREIREDLKYAVSFISDHKIAIDCGCGAGADIDYLISNGFTVYGFDIEEESISRCRERFSKNDNVVLSRSSFVDFKYPKASLVVADASLFFCPTSDFEKVWADISDCLFPDGIFCGSFLGKEDTMAVPGDNPAALWPNITAFDELEVLELFKEYELLRFSTHKSSGKNSLGALHNWHIYHVVAQRN